jgi:uncharacterized repeat protein (TIGR03803 family)
LFGAATVSAQSYLDLHEFDGLGGGCCPQYTSIMAQGRDGTIYGTTSTGGLHSVGIVFRITPTGSFSVLYNFDKTHGSTPVGGLVLGTDGNFYGTTELGSANGYGNIFKITPAGVLTVLYNFTGNADGGLTVAPLIVGMDGNFYGTTYPGVAFKLSPSGVFKVIGKIPTVSYAPLLQADDGAFYGVTQFGGTHSAGAIYKIVGTKVTTLYSFDGPHGAYPIGGLVQGADGNLYGTTTSGGSGNAGVIFRMTTTGTLTVLVNFDPKSPLNGYQADAGLIAGNDGNLYGATVWGGTDVYGTIFEMSTSGSYSVLNNFNAPYGAGPYSTPMQHTSGVIFGMTARGGTAGKGVVYSFNNGIVPFRIAEHPRRYSWQLSGDSRYGFSGTTRVTFNGTPASFRVLNDTYLTAIVPSGETGFVSVTTSSGILLSSRIFKVTPKITSFTPSKGPSGSTVTVTGSGLIQATKITVGGVQVGSFTVNSDTKVTLRVPSGAKTGKIVITTPGGIATSSKTFTVN